MTTSLGSTDPTMPSVWGPLLLAPLVAGLIGYAIDIAPDEVRTLMLIWVFGSVPMGIAVGSLILDKE